MMRHSGVKLPQIERRARPHVNVIALCRLEILRLVRDWKVVAGLAPMLALTILLGIGNPTLTGAAPVNQIVQWAMMAVTFTGFGYCVAFVDAAPSSRDDRRGTDELLASTPCLRSVHVAVRLVASLSLTLPVLVLLLVVGTIALIPGQGASALAAAVPAYVLIVLPGVLVSLALASALGAYLRPALARVLALVVWAWSILVSPGVVPIPSPSGTLFSPAGGYVGAGIFHGDGMFSGTAPWLSPAPNPTWAVVSLVVILVQSLVLIVIGGARPRR